MEYRVVVLGDMGIGKRALILRFIRGQFVRNGRYSRKYDPTVEDSYRKEVEIAGISRALDITNIVGQEIRSDHFMQSADGVILAYSIASQNSFEVVQKLKNSLSRARAESHVPTMLAGTQSDLESKRQISTEVGRELAEKWQMGFIEVSSKSNTNVNNLFFELVKMIDEWRIKNPINKNVTTKKYSACCLL